MSKILELYLESGVDEIISEMPINRLIPREEKVQEIETKVHSQINHKNITTFAAISTLAARSNNSQITSNLVPINDVINKSKEMAKNAQNLDELKKAVLDFDGCSLKKMATNTVFADGNPDSPIMIIGEAPGNQEDMQGIPFCGEIGELLSAMFKNIGFKREDLYITNTLFWRPPGNRRPTEDELAMCKPFVEKHIFLKKPKLIILMGATAMQDILEIKDPISKARGKFYDYQNEYLEDPIKTCIFFHPSYLIRQPSKKREAWKDLLMIKEFLAN
ncbi:MAG: DNA polymerase [Lentimonas sp.]|jgi:DNA polymerase